jgi:hypothetical protein
MARIQQKRGSRPVIKGMGRASGDGRRRGLGTVAAGAAASVLAAPAAVAYPRAGRALDTARISAGADIATGLLLIGFWVSPYVIAVPASSPVRYAMSPIRAAAPLAFNDRGPTKHEVPHGNSTRFWVWRRVGLFRCHDALGSNSLRRSTY